MEVSLVHLKSWDIMFVTTYYYEVRAKIFANTRALWNRMMQDCHMWVPKRKKFQEWIEYKDQAKRGEKKCKQEYIQWTTCNNQFKYVSNYSVSKHKLFVTLKANHKCCIRNLFFSFIFFFNIWYWDLFFFFFFFFCFFFFKHLVLRFTAKKDPWLNPWECWKLLQPITHFRWEDTTQEQA